MPLSPREPLESGLVLPSSHWQLHGEQRPEGPRGPARMGQGDTAELCLQPWGPLSDQAGFHLHAAEETWGEENTTEKPGLRGEQQGLLRGEEPERGPAACPPPAPSLPSSGPGEPTIRSPFPVILTALPPLRPVLPLLSAPAPEATHSSQDSARRLSPSVEPLLSSPCP